MKTIAGAQHFVEGRLGRQFVIRVQLTPDEFKALFDAKNQRHDASIPAPKPCRPEEQLTVKRNFLKRFEQAKEPNFLSQVLSSTMSLLTTPPQPA